MRRKELNERSPLRALEQSIHGGLGRGNVGVVVARHGVGKTAFLVGVALDGLLRDLKVLHISLDQRMEQVRSFYDELFQDLAHERELENVWKVRTDVERNRRIHCFAGHVFSMARLRETLAFMRDHSDFTPDKVIVDGMDFEQVEPGDLVDWKEIARSADAELWMSAITTRDSGRSTSGVPDPVAAHESAVDVILSMAHDGKRVHVELLKDHDNPTVPELKIALDPTTLLLVTE
jgi:hypothetical protein